MPALVFAAPRFGGSSIDYRSDLCVDLDQELHPGDQGLNIRKCTHTVSVATLLGDRAGPSRRRRPGDTNRQDVGTVSLLQNASGRACPPHSCRGQVRAAVVRFGWAALQSGQHAHGIMAGPGHAGDMPNLHIPPTGSLEVELVNTAVTKSLTPLPSRRQRSGDSRRQRRLHDRSGRKRR